MLVSEALRKASIVLNDLTFVRWPVDELIGWLNEARVAIIKAQPTANTITTPIRLEQGTLQAVPVVAVQLVRITRNLMDNRPDARIGRAVITVVDRAEMDAARPGWHDPRITPYKDVVRHVIYEEASPRTFYVYPGNTGLGTVEAVYSVNPASIAVVTGQPAEGYTAEIGLRSQYDDTVLNYMLWRALSKDAPYAEAQMAQGFFQLVATDLGIQFQMQATANPNRKSPAGPANP